MGTPTAAECATYRERYAEADLALHRLLTGSRTESVRMGEKTVTYTRASVGELRSYVSYLKSKVDQCDGKCTAGRRVVHVIPAN